MPHLSQVPLPDFLLVCAKDAIDAKPEIEAV
jgi:hypothetical protein